MISESPHVPAANRYRPPYPPRTTRTFPSADAMITAYAELRTKLSTASRRWPDPNTPPPDSISGRSPQELYGPLLGDMARCLKLAKLDPEERLVLRHLYRFRGRWCRRCRRSFHRMFDRTGSHADRRHCPQCGAGRLEGWVWESYPTVTVLVEEMGATTKHSWKYQQVYRIRERAYGKVEQVMARRGMLRIR